MNFVPIIAKNQKSQRTEFSVTKPPRYPISTQSFIPRHLQPQENFFHPCPVFRFHHAGAQAGDLVCVPVLHRVGGFEQGAGEAGEGEVQVVRFGGLLQLAGALRGGAGGFCLDGPGDDVEFGGEQWGEPVVETGVFGQRAMQGQRGGAAGLQALGEFAAGVKRQHLLRGPQGDGGGAGAGAFEGDFAQVGVVGIQVGVGRVVPVVAFDVGVAEQDAAAAVGLQAVFVRVDGDGVGLADGVEGAAGGGGEVVGQGEVAAVGGIDVQAEGMARAQGDDFVEWVDAAGAGGAEAGDHGADLAGGEEVFQRLYVHPPESVGRDGLERYAEHAGQAGVGVMRLRRCGDGAAGMLCKIVFPRDPQRFEVGQRAAAAQVAEKVFPAEHGGNFGHRFLFHQRAGAAAVEGVVVGVEPERQGVGQARRRMRRFLHVAEVERVMVGVVVAQSFGGCQQRGAQRGGVDLRGGVGQVGEARFQRRQRLIQQRQAGVVEGFAGLCGRGHAAGCASQAFNRSGL